MKEATVCYLLRENGNGMEVLLGQRRSLFCDGIWNGPGGKFKNKRETILNCLKREVDEEVAVEIELPSTKHFATLDAYHPHESGHQLEWRVYFLAVTSWRGKPRLTDAFEKLEWFPLEDLPYAQMMPDTMAWTRLALNNRNPEKLLEVDIYYADKDLKSVQRGLFQFVHQLKGLPKRKL